MIKIRVNDIEIACRDEGAGSALVFLHAFPLDQSIWNEQVAAFTPDYRVITCDWRGFGGTSLGSRPPGMDTFAEDLAGLLDALNVERATLCALSMGGYGTFAFYRRFAERVEALILCDTRATPDTEEGKSNRRQLAARVLEGGPLVVAEAMMTKLLGATTLAERPAVVARVQAIIEATSAEAIAAALHGMAGRADSTDLLGGINIPTLVLVGEEDTLTPPEEAERMAQAIPGVRYEIIPEAGHLPNLERPDEFNRLLAGFLKSR